MLNEDFMSTDAKYIFVMKYLEANGVWHQFSAKGGFYVHQAKGDLESRYLFYLKTDGCLCPNWLATRKNLEHHR